MKRAQSSQFIKINCLVILLISGLAGCSLNKMAVRSMQGVMDGLSKAFYQQEDIELAKEGGASFLLFIDGLLRENPTDTKLLMAGIQAYTAYSSAFLLEETPQRAFRLYRHALVYGDRLLKEEFHEASFRTLPPETIRERLKSASREDVPIVYWTASAWAGWIITHPDQMLGMADLPSVVEMMKWVLNTEPTYQGGGAHLFFGVYHASKPKALGGKPEKAKQHFLEAIRIAGEESLMPKVLYAKYYARMVFDENLFQTTLQAVLDAPETTNPDLNLSNALARQAARQLLDNMEDFF